MFSRGIIRIIVGTAALLGEGWDAPCINSLIMASCVGSFMLSNPMRGRAVRVDPDNPEKTGAIWHLACVDVEQNQGGHDLSSLSRGFRSLVGLSADHDSIKSGIGRMGLRLQPLNERTIRENNENTLERARNRHLLRDRWNRAVAVHEEGRMTEEIRIPKARVPKPYHFGNTIRSLVVTALTAFVWIFTDSFMNMVRHSDDMRTIILIALLVATLYALPKAGKALLLSLGTSPPSSTSGRRCWSFTARCTNWACLNPHLPRGGSE